MNDSNAQDLSAAAPEPVESTPDASQADTTPEQVAPEQAPAEAPAVTVETAENVTVNPPVGDQVSEDTPGVPDDAPSEDESV